jgi:hypothetical protein
MLLHALSTDFGRSALHSVRTARRVRAQAARSRRAEQEAEAAR